MALSRVVVISSFSGGMDGVDLPQKRRDAEIRKECCGLKFLLNLFRFKMIFALLSAVAPLR